MADVKRYNVNPDEHCLDEMYETDTGHYVEYDNYDSLRASHSELLRIVRDTYLVGITDELSYIEAAIAKAEKL